jgi:hypothetical protein
MQMKGLKYISVLLLVNIGILVGHNLVPHRHHVTSIDHPLSNECPETHKCPTTPHEHHDKTSGTKHCHALNNIVFVNYSQSLVPIPEKLSSVIIIREPGYVPDLNTGISSTPGHILKQLTLAPELSGNHSLRGPPVLS